MLTGKYSESSFLDSPSLFAPHPEYCPGHSATQQYNPAQQYNPVSQLTQQDVSQQVEFLPKGKELPLMSYILGVVDPVEDLGWAPREEESEAEGKKEKAISKKKSYSVYTIIFLYILLGISLVGVIFLALWWKKKISGKEADGEERARSPEVSSTRSPAVSPAAAAASAIAAGRTIGGAAYKPSILFHILEIIFVIVTLVKLSLSSATKQINSPAPLHDPLATIKEKEEFLMKAYSRRLREAKDEEVTRCVKYLAKKGHFRGVENSKRDVMLAMLYAEEVKRGIEV